MVDIPGLPYDGVTDVVDESGNGKGVALNVWPSDNRIPIADDPVPLDTFVLEQGELAYARTSQRLRVGDGYTPGGDEVAFTSDMDTFTQDLTDLENNLMTAMSGKANITGGNVFTGDQTFNGSVSVSGNLTVGGTFAVANISVTDQVYGVAWNNSTQVPTKNAVYDKIQSLATADISGLDTALAGKAPLVHTHVIADVTNLQTTLNGKAPLVHTHVIADVTNLQTTLDAKAPLVHTHVIADVTNLQASLDAKASLALVSTSAAGLAPTRPGGTTAFLRADGAWAAPSFPGGGVTTFPLTINSDGGAAASPATFDGSVARTISYNTVGAAPLNHTHAIANVTGLQAALDSKAASVHTHVITDVTGLQAALDAKATVVQLGNYLPLAGGTVTGQLNTSAGQFHSGSIFTRIQCGGAGAPTGASGIGLELYQAAGNSYVNSYNRTAGAVAPLVLTGSTVTVDGNTTVTGLITTQGTSAGMNLTARDFGNNFILSVNTSGILTFYSAGAPRATLSDAGNLAVTGTITQGGNAVATVSQLANYLPLTGGTIAGVLNVTPPASGDNGMLTVSPSPGYIYSFLQLKGATGLVTEGLNLQCGNQTSYFGSNNFNFRSAANVTYMALGSAGLSVDRNTFWLGPQTGAASDLVMNYYSSNFYQFHEYNVAAGGAMAVRARMIITSAGFQYRSNNYTFYNLAADATFGILDATGLALNGIGDFLSPNSGSTGGVRIRGQGGYAYMQITDNPVSTQWSAIRWAPSGEMYHSGAFVAGGNISSLSDRRVKTNIRGLTSGLRIVNALRGVRFIKDDKPDLGVIAQEVQKLLPELVSEDAEGMLSVDYGRITAVLIEAVKELTNRVQKLEAAR